MHCNLTFRNKFLKNAITFSIGTSVFPLCTEDSGGQVFHPVLMPGVILTGFLYHAHSLIRIKLHHHGNLRIVPQIIYQLGIAELIANLSVREIVRQQKRFGIL